MFGQCFFYQINSFFNLQRLVVVMAFINHKTPMDLYLDLGARFGQVVWKANLPILQIFFYTTNVQGKKTWADTARH